MDTKQGRRMYRTQENSQSQSRGGIHVNAKRTRNTVLILAVATLMGSIVACSCGGLGSGRSGGGAQITAPPSGGGGAQVTVAPSGGSDVTPTPTEPPMPGLTAPAAPSNLRAPSWSMTSIHLAWDDNADNEEGFQVFRQGQSGPIAQTGPDETQVEIENSPCDQTIQLRVRAFNAAGNSGYSNVINVQTAPCGSSAAGPDLVVEEVAGPTADWTVNNPIPFQVSIRNAGSAPAQGIQWRWSINRANEGPGQWNTMGQLFNLAAGESTVLNGSIPPQSSGRWVIYVEVRVTQGEESNTENNRGTARVVVQ